MITIVGLWLFTIMVGVVYCVDFCVLAILWVLVVWLNWCVFGWILRIAFLVVDLVWFGCDGSCLQFCVFN